MRLRCGGAAVEAESDSRPLARFGITVRGVRMRGAPRSAAWYSGRVGSFGVPACVVQSLHQALGQRACGKGSCLSDWLVLGDLLGTAAIVPFCL